MQVLAIAALLGAAFVLWGSWMALLPCVAIFLIVFYTFAP